MLLRPIDTRAPLILMQCLSDTRLVLGGTRVIEATANRLFTDALTGSGQALKLSDSGLLLLGRREVSDTICEWPGIRRNHMAARL